MLRKKKGFILYVLGFLSIIAVATAGVSYGGNTVTVPVKVNLVGSCDIQNTPEINFGDVNPLDAATDLTSTSALNFTCSSGTTYKIELDKGKYYKDTDKRMKHESKDNYIVYGLSTPCSTGTGTGSQVSCDITGTISKSVSLKDNPVGKYNDDVIVTITATN